MAKYKDEDLRPDGQWIVKDIPILLMEVKKANNVKKYRCNKDALKLPHMMKLSLDLAIKRQIENPTIVGLLVQSRLQIGWLLLFRRFQLPHSLTSFTY